MTASRESVAVSLQLQEIAQRLDVDIQRAAGKRVAFTLLVFTDGQTNYVSNAPRGDSVREVKRLLEQWESGMPDIPVHDKN
jgi:hypothetical protein